jgi:hypothetical protein
MLAKPRSLRFAAIIEPLHDPGSAHLAHSSNAFNTSTTLAWNDVVDLGEIEYLCKVLFAGAQAFFISARRRRGLGRGKARLLTLLSLSGGNRHSARPHLAARREIRQTCKRISGLEGLPQPGAAFISPSVRVAAACGAAGLVGGHDLTTAGWQDESGCA